MPTIHYLADIDRLNAKKILTPLIESMSEHELRISLLYLLHGMDVYDSIYSAISLIPGAPELNNERR